MASLEKRAAAGGRGKRRYLYDKFALDTTGLLVRVAGPKPFKKAIRRGNKDAAAAQYSQQLVVPEQFVPELLRLSHEAPLAAHEGARRLLAALAVKYWWRTMQVDVRRYVAECDTCQRADAPTGPVPGLLQPLPAPSRPWQRVHIDGAGPLPETRNGNKFFLVMVDAFSKWPEVVPLKTFDATSVAEAFVREVVQRHAAPEVLVSDRGT